jgi:hypothetical protein
MDGEAPHPAPDDLLSLEEAAAALGIAVEQAEVLVDQGVLVRADGIDDRPMFTSAAVEAVRLQGG